MSQVVSLVIADPSAIRSAGIEAILQHHGGVTVIRAAASADAACAAVPVCQPAVCLVHESLVRRDLGWLDQLRTAAPHTAVVVYDAAPQDARARALLRAGVRAILPASTTAAELPGLLAALVTDDRQGAVPAESAAPPGRATQARDDEHWTVHVEELLTEHQRHVLGLLVAGLSNRQIASRLNRSEHTVRAHLRHIYQRLGTRNRAQAAAWLVMNGLDQAELPALAATGAGEESCDR